MLNLVLSLITVLGCSALVIIFALFPRLYHQRQLRHQLKVADGFVFTPDKALWGEVTAKKTPLALPMILGLYSVAVLTLMFSDSSQLAIQVTLAAGCYLLLYLFFAGIPPTFGVTQRGITILSWLPQFPLAPYGSGSTYLPWRNISVCEIGDQYFTALTGKQEAIIVYPLELEDQVCTFLDAMLRQQGYQVQ